MFYQYLKIAYRNLSRQKLVSFINIFGLGMAMSVGLLQGVILQHEVDYDRFHPHPDRTYRVLSDLTAANGNRYTLASSPLPLAGKLAADSQSIEAALVVQPVPSVNFNLDNREANFSGAWVHGDFFTVFGFELEKGNPRTALSAPGNLVLSHAAAARYFGTEEAIGKTIQLPGRPAMLVSGVMKVPPGKTHLDYDGFAYTATPDTGSWFNMQQAYTYLLLKDAEGKSGISRELTTLSNDLSQRGNGSKFGFELQQLKDIRPADRDLYNDIGRGTSWSKLQTGITVSLIILLAACFNYINLAIARAMAKGKEVGIRKIIGAKRRQIFGQYLVDSLLSTALALVFAWFLLSFIVSYAPFNDDYELIPSSWNYNGYFIAASIAFAGFTALVAGVIPAYMLSAFDPLKVLKNLRTFKIFGRMGLQKSLIVFQYSFSLVVLIFLMTFFRQFNFLAKQDMHFKQENLLVIDLQGVDGQIAAQQLEKLAGVQALVAASPLFNPHFNGRKVSVQSGLPQIEKQAMNTVVCQPAFLTQIAPQFIAGKNLPADNQDGSYAVLNEAAARRLGFREPQNAAGASVILDDTMQCTITGVIRDFNYEKSGKRIDPLVFRTGKTFSHLYCSVEADQVAGTKDRIMAAWPATGSRQPARVSRLADDIERNNSQKGTLSILTYLSFIALSIASLGLLGLVIFSVENRRKEVSIRKVIGASRLELMRLLSFGFVRLLLISGAISIPIGFMMSFFFLQNFLERVGLLFPFALVCFAAMFCIGLVTIGSQVLAVTAQNPVNALRED